MSEFGSQDLATSAWSCAVRNVQDVPLRQALAPAALRTRYCSARELATTAWAFEAMTFWAIELLDAISVQSINTIKASVDEPGQTQAAMVLLDATPHARPHGGLQGTGLHHSVNF